VAFRLYGPSDSSCGGLPAYIEEAEVAGSSAATTTGFVVPSEGTWRWTATYLGDENNNVSASTCDHAPVAVVTKVPKPPKNPGGTPFQTNIYFNCIDDHNIGVPYGGRLVLRLGWAALTEKQVDGFLHGTRTRAVIDGVPVPHAATHWGQSVRTAREAGSRGGSTTPAASSRPARNRPDRFSTRADDDRRRSGTPGRGCPR
jgi:hypothetical protein